MKELILLPGALGNQNHFSALREILQPHFDVYSLDFSGHAGKTCEEDFSIELFVNDLHDYINKNNLEKPDIFGYSMGGYVALKFVLESPERVGKIMTLATKLDWNAESAAKEEKMLNWKKMEEKIPDFTAVLKKENQPNDWRKLVEKTAKMIQGLGHGKAVPIQDFAEIKNSVLVVRGSEDNMVSKEESQKLAEILPRGKFLEIPDCKHPFPLVDQRKLSEIMIEYFAA